MSMAPRYRQYGLWTTRPMKNDQKSDSANFGRLGQRFLLAESSKIRLGKFAKDNSANFLMKTWANK